MDLWTTFCGGWRGWFMNKDKFVLAPIKRPYTDNKKGETVRVSKDAYNTLVDMANESSMSMSQIVSKAIIFAYERLEYGYEREENE